MSSVELQIQQTDSELPLPKYMTEGSSGMDLYAAETAVIQPGATALIPTGIKISIPHGYEIQIRPRSGLALKHGITMLNTPGTIDSDYRGMISCIVINHGKDPYHVEYGSRIAQMVCQKVERVSWVKVDELEQTVRSDGGFGHTGKN